MQKEKKLAEIEKRMESPDFWNDRELAEETVSSLKGLRSVIGPLRELREKIDELKELVSLEETDGEGSLIGEIEVEIGSLGEKLKLFELKVLLSGAHDVGNALMIIHPGAGGTESQDWAEMLLRLYKRYIENHGYEYRLLDLQPGDEAGIKNATLEIRGEYAYGRLKS